MGAIGILRQGKYIMRISIYHFYLNSIFHLQGVATSCWQIALTRFRELSIECDVSSETVKILLALTLTRCHFINRGAKGGFPLEDQDCQLNRAFKLKKEISELGDRTEGTTNNEDKCKNPKN